MSNDKIIISNVKSQISNPNLKSQISNLNFEFWNNYFAHFCRFFYWWFCFFFFSTNLLSLKR